MIRRQRHTPIILNFRREKRILISAALTLRSLRLQGFQMNSRNIRGLVIIAALGAALLVDRNETLEFHLVGRSRLGDLRFPAKRECQ